MFLNVVLDLPMLEKCLHRRRLLLVRGYTGMPLPEVNLWAYSQKGWTRRYLRRPTGLELVSPELAAPPVWAWARTVGSSSRATCAPTQRFRPAKTRRQCEP